MTSNAHDHDTALAEIRALIAAATFDRKLNQANRQLDLVSRCLEISRTAGVPDAEIMAMVRESLSRVLEDALPPPRRARRRLLPPRRPSVDAPPPAALAEPAPSQLPPGDTARPWTPPKPPIGS
ncbi:MAG: hypothetical protein JWQ20_811 [Conexibacter sp.]|nr:hypothetical protein [Conexibacter sp.]